MIQVNNKKVSTDANTNTNTNTNTLVICAKGRVLRKLIQKTKQQKNNNNANTNTTNTAEAATTTTTNAAATSTTTTTTTNNNDHGIGTDTWLGLDHAKEWQSLVTELLSMEKNQINKDTIDLFDKIARDSDRFYLMELGKSNNDNDRDEHFLDFHNIQQTVHNLNKLISNINKRPRDSVARPDSLQLLTNSSSSGKKQKA